MRLLRENLKPRPYRIDRAIASSVRQAEIWDFPVTTERSRLLSCLLYGLLYELKKKKIIQAEVVNLHLAMRAFTESFIISNPRQNSVDSRQWTSPLENTFLYVKNDCHRLKKVDEGFFPTLVAKLQKQKVVQNNLNKRWKKILTLQNELLRITRSSHSLSTIFLRLLHFGRFMD